MEHIVIFLVEMLWRHFHFLLDLKSMESLKSFQKSSLVMALHIGNQAEPNIFHLAHELIDDLRFVLL